MALIDRRTYRSYTLELSEFGDTGWRLTVYAPLRLRRAERVAMLTTVQSNGLADLRREGRAAVDRDCDAIGPLAGLSRPVAKPLERDGLRWNHRKA